MISIGTTLLSLPVTLHRVRDIEAFEGPLLTEFRTDRGDLYLYLWCDSDGSGHHRWLVFRAAERELIRYTHRATSLRQLVDHTLDGYYFVIDTDHDGRTSRAALALRSEIPDEYLPDNGWIDPSGGAY